MSRFIALRWFTLCVAVLAVSCSDDGGGEDVSFDVVVPDAGETDAVDTSDEPDVGVDTTFDVDAEPEFTPEELLCRPCDIAADCGDGNFCLEGYPGETSFCSADCVRDPDICPDGTTCTDLTVGGLQRACVPDDLLICPCQGVECEEPQYCDPYQAACADRPGLCEPCDGPGQCGDGNYCLEYLVEGGRTERGCATACTPGSCPEGFDCLNVNVGDGTARLCIPETRTCVDRCSDVTCDEPQYCDPLTGDCVDPAPYCETCSADYQCGVDNPCVGLQGGSCITTADCPSGEQCSTDGVCLSFHCSVPCDPDSTDLDQCPEEAACIRTGAEEGLCIPYRGTCRERCAGVTCEDGFTCDDRSGECVESLYGICDNCPTNAECGGYDDLCVNLDGAPRCFYGCGDGLDPCPVGYECFELFNALSFCVPENFTGSCAECVDMSCPQGEACLPIDGSCLPEPTPCESEAGEECALDEVCDTFEGRCEPIGVACDEETAFLNCAIFTAYCTSPAPGLPGTCEPSCFSDTGCDQDRPYCQLFHEASGRVCTSDPVGGAHTCGVLADADVAWGQPCLVVDDPTDPEICPSETTTLCLEGVDPNVPGICTRECTSDEDCPGGRCGDLDGTGSYCLPDSCACLERPDLPEGEVDVLASLLADTGTTRCGLAWSIVERRRLYGVLDVEDPFRAPLVTPLQGAPLDAIAALRAEQTAVLDAAGWRDGIDTTLALAARAWDVELVGVRGYTIEVEDGALAGAIDEALLDLGGVPLTDEARTALTALDDTLEAELAELVLRTRDLAVFQRDTFAPRVTGSLDGLPIDLAQRFFPGVSAVAWYDAEVQRLFGARAVRAEVATLARLTAAALAAAPTCTDCDGPRERIVVPTDAGDLVFAGVDADSHDLSGVPLLLVDAGGDDTYRGAAGANGGIERPAALVVDLGGADTYDYEPVPADGDGGLLPSDGTGRAEPEVLGNGAVSLSVTPRQGAGVFGAGAVLDLGAGTDRYTSLRFSQGFGLVGAGFLVDEEGDAELEMEVAGQGAGLAGLGVLWLGDAGATVDAVHAAQGFGGPGGVGVLVGGAGDDTYTLDPSLDAAVLYFDDLTRTADSLSAGQGAGVGVAPEGARGVSGGVGVLVERGGADRYDAGVAAQGAGFWHGAGFLLDAAGDDVYTASSLALGAAESLGVGVFEDLSGDDDYGIVDEREARTAAGAAQDLGVGVFVDRDGNDEHAHSFRSMGYGQLNGFGLFFDAAGDDRYVADANESMGGAVLTIVGSEPASNPRRTLGTFGFFLDTAGRDAYERPDLLNPPIGDELRWVQTSRDEAALPTFGGGFDGVGATGL